MTGKTVIGAPAKKGSDEIAEGAKDKDQADSIQSTGCVVSKLEEARTTCSGRHAENNESDVVSNRGDDGMCVSSIGGRGHGKESFVFMDRLSNL